MAISIAPANAGEFHISERAWSSRRASSPIWTPKVMDALWTLWRHA